MAREKQVTTPVAQNEILKTSLLPFYENEHVAFYSKVIFLPKTWFSGGGLPP
jgi:hypothetical protein